MQRRDVITGLIAGLAMPFVARPAVATTGSILARGAGPLIDLDTGASLYEMYDPEPEPSQEGPMGQSPQVDFAAGTPVLKMWNIHTDERIAVRPVQATGVDHTALDQVNRFMRDWRRNEVKPIDANAVVGLLEIQEQARRQGFSGDMRFLSGYRSRATNDAIRAAGANAARNSLHIQAKAIDFSLPGVSIRDTIQLAKGLHMGGVGGYDTFVHVDTGRVRFWGTAA